MNEQRDTRMCPVCTDGRIVSRALGQKVSTVCLTCAGEVMIPADHPIFSQQQQASEEAPAVQP
jgi:hypothetical protein